MDKHDHPQILRAKANLQALKSAIRAERANIADYEDRLKTGRGGFPKEGLLHGLERCRHNLDVLKKASAAERQAIADVRYQEEVVERIAAIPRKVTIEAE
jgi:hypothetical protein